MNAAVASLPQFDRLQRMAIIGTIPAVAVAVVGYLVDPAQFFRSYLLAYLFWLSFGLGSLGIYMLHNLAGGKWGVWIHYFLTSGAGTLPLMALLALPLFAGIPLLYEWSHADVVAADPILRHKQPYLNPPFFILRTAIYFAIWIGLAALLRKRLSSPLDPQTQTSLRIISGPGLIVFMFACTFAAVDWVMSLEPHWFSTIYGAIFVVGQTLQTFALCAAVLALLARYRPFAGLLAPEHFHDIGNLMLAFTVLWAYTSFSQFLIIWSGNIPEETPWYLRRSNNGWQVVGVFLVVFHFVVPFFILLNRFVKRRGELLARVAVAIILVRMLDLFYWIEPSHGAPFHFHWLYLVTPLAIGGLWVAVFLAGLKKSPLLEASDPRIQPQLHGGH